MHPLNPHLTHSPSPPLLLPLHRVNPELAVCDHANPKRSIRAGSKLSAFQGAAKDQTAKKWRQPEKKRYKKKNGRVGRGQFYERKRVKKNTFSRTPAGPGIKSRKGQGKEGAGQQEGAEKSEWNDKMRRWVLNKFNHSFYSHVLPHPRLKDTAVSTASSSRLCLRLPSDRLMHELSVESLIKTHLLS